MAILAVCRRFKNRRLHSAGLRLVCQQEHLFPHCFGTFSISSFPPRFILKTLQSENNFNMASRKWRILILCCENTSLSLTAREFSTETTQSAIQKPTLRQREVARFTHVPPKHQYWAYSGLENKRAPKQI